MTTSHATGLEKTHMILIATATVQINFPPCRSPISGKRLLIGVEGGTSFSSCDFSGLWFLTLDVGHTALCGWEDTATLPQFYRFKRQDMGSDSPAAAIGMAYLQGGFWE